MIDKSKQYRTRDGREARIYATDHSGTFPIVGAIFTDAQWLATSWTSEGTWSSAHSEGKADLIEIKPRIKRTVWVRVYDNYCTHSSVEPVDISPYCLACVKVEIDCEHGEGL